MNKNRVVLFFSFFFLVIALLLSIIDYNCFDKSFYRKEYIQNDTCSATGMNEEDLWDTTTVLFDYLKDNRDDLNVEHEVNGTVREIFDKREKTHMVDVKNLYLNAMHVRTVFVVIGSILLVLSFILSKNDFIHHMYISYQRSVAMILCLIVAIAIFAAIDFDTFWVQFHYLFFTNDLFFLDPNTEILINMVPEQFFFDLVLRIIIMFFISVIVLYVFFRILDKKRIKHDQCRII